GSARTRAGRTASAPHTSAPSTLQDPGDSTHRPSATNIAGVLEVRQATPADRRDVVRVMAKAFDDDPVTRWLVPDGRSLEPLFAAHARWAHGSPGNTDIALIDGEPVGAAFWDPPGYRLSTARQLASIPAYAWALRRHLGRGATVEGV